MRSEDPDAYGCAERGHHVVELMSGGHACAICDAIVTTGNDEASILGGPVEVDWPPLAQIGREVDAVLWLGRRPGSGTTVSAMRERRGLYLHGIFAPRGAGDCWHAGWTAEGATGWNGVPDYYAAGSAANEALWRAMWLALVHSPEAAGI